MKNKTRQPTIVDAVNLDHVLEFSYSAYHADAIDYLCLFRSTGLTIKAYFFDEEVTHNVVIPHTHRYDFDTRVVAGSLREVRYNFGNTNGFPVAYIRYRYDSIVEGGAGFTAEGADILSEESSTMYVSGMRYSNRAHKDIHTLRNVEPGTILILTQYADYGSPSTYAWSATVPAVGDIYRPMDYKKADQYLEKLQAALSEK